MNKVKLSLPVIILCHLNVNLCVLSKYNHRQSYESIEASCWPVLMAKLLKMRLSMVFVPCKNVMDYLLLEPLRGIKMSCLLGHDS